MSDPELNSPVRKSRLAARANIINVALLVLVFVALIGAAVVIINNSLLGKAHVLPLLIIVASVLFLYVISSNLLVNRMIYMPIGRLIRSVAQGKVADEDFYGVDRDDDIGDLARTIRGAVRARCRQEQLVHAVNSTAAVLLAPADKADFEASLLKGMELMGRCVEVDRVHIWRNEAVEGIFCYVNEFRWMNDTGRQQEPASTKRPYYELPEWERKFLQKEYINGPVSAMSQPVRAILEPQGIKSVLAIPVYLQGNFCGFFSFDDCQRERSFPEDEVDILRSAGLMLASAINNQAQAAQLREAHAHSNALLNAMPFGCRLWDSKYKIFECNDESVKFFNLRNKQEYMEKYFQFSAEYQPDGQLSRDKALNAIQKAFEEGRYVLEWEYTMPDGALLPTEITLVRVRQGDEYVVAGYTRDLREYKQMMMKIDKRDNLLGTVNSVANVMLAARDDENFEALLVKGMELMGRCLDVDRVQIWQNETLNEEPCFVRKYEWLSDFGRRMVPIPANLTMPYRSKPEWERKFVHGEHINGPVSSLPQDDQVFLGAYAVQSVVLIPLFLQNQFWGFLSIDDCRKERVFAEDEIDILRSGSLMMISAVNRNAQAALLRHAHGRTQLLLDTMPLTGHLWRKNCSIIDCNEEAVKLFHLRNKKEYIDRFFDLSPEYQPDGQLSREKAFAYNNTAFEEGRCVFEWMHQTLDGTPIPAEITLVRVNFGDEDVVAAYARDMRDSKQMMLEIDRRDRLLKTVNNAATVLLRSEADQFENDLMGCMGMIAEAIDIDRVYIWKNHLIKNRLYCTQFYEWSGGAKPQQGSQYTVNISYEETLPSWLGKLSSGHCINSLVRELSPVEQSNLVPQGIISIFVLPVFWRDQFWGFVGYDDCHRERLFSENEQSILRSGGLLLANALLRNDNVTEMMRLQSKLQEALKDAQVASKAKTSFLANMSHEMRTPLNAIIGLSELTLDTVDSPEETHLNLGKIYNAGLTLLSTVNDVLDISKIEAGKFEIIPVEYAIPSLLNDTITQSIMHVGEKPIRFILDIDENLPNKLFGDDLRIKQVFNNLLSNAFKYTREGSVTLAMRCNKTDDTVWMTASVKDTGIGIRPEDIDGVFSDYTKVDTTANRNIMGTGLGMPITKRVVEMMGGTLTVESEYGKGSTFTIKIQQKYVDDVVIGPEVAKRLMSFTYSDQRRKNNAGLVRIKLPYARVLVVDDVATNLDVAKGMMKPYGMQVDCMTSARSAIAAVRDEKVKYNAIFMDHMMPEMDGIEATRIIRSDIGTEYAKTVPIIALTANAIVGNEDMFLRKGFQAFLSKPIDMSRLDVIIRQWVRNKELEEKLGVKEELSAPPPEKPARGFPMQVEGVDLQKGLQSFGGDEESYLGVLRSYVVNTGPLLEKIKSPDKNDLANYAIVAHGIKGSSRGISAEFVGGRAEALEKAAKAGDFNFVMANNAALIEAAQKLIGGLETLLEKMAKEEGAKPAKEKPDSEVLGRLRAACDAGDLDEVDKAMAEIERYAYTSDDGLAVWLREMVDQMDFSQINERLSNE